LCVTAGVAIVSVNLINRKITPKDLTAAYMYISLPIALINTIVYSIMFYAALYRDIGILDGGKEIHLPTTCLYFSIVTWTTLGYGDVTPRAETRLLASSEALIGYVVMAAVIACFTMILTRIVKEGSQEGAAGGRRIVAGLSHQPQ
jgi:Ion channel